MFPAMLQEQIIFVVRCHQTFILPLQLEERCSGGHRCRTNLKIPGLNLHQRLRRNKNLPSSKFVFGETGFVGETRG